jgi:serine phosphatase RsbU (regulator of sigma subunit)
VEGIPLGLLDDREYEEVEFQAAGGDVILLCSDGVLDQLDHAEEEFGSSRTFQLLRSVCGYPVQRIVESVFAALDRHRDQVSLTDDQSVIAIRVD